MNKIKLHWQYRYVKEDILQPDKFNRWLIEGSIKVDCSDLAPYEYLDYRYAKVAFITMKGTENANFLNHESLPKFNVRIGNVLEQTSLFNTGIGAASQFFDDIGSCKKFAEEAFNFHYDILNRAQKL